MTNTKLLRILHTVAHYPPAVAGGGATHVVRRISEGLARRGHAVTVATAYSPERANGHVLNGVSVQQFRVHGVLQQSVLGIRGEEIGAFCRFMRERDFDIVMNYAAQTWHTDLTCRCLQDIRARTVLAACGYSGLVGWRRPLYWAYFHRLPRYLRQYDAVVYHATGYQDERFGASHGIAHAHVIPNGIDSAEFAGSTVDFRAAYGINTPHILLTVGDHYHNKGHARVLKAFERMERTDTSLVVIGRRMATWPRSCWRTCEHASQRLGRRVILLDQAPRTHVVAAYKAADVFLSGSHIEAFPLVILEAMAASLPFVAFPAGNIADLPGGIVVASETEMAESAARLLDDADRSRRIGAKGRSAQREHYEWDNVVGKYEALYRELLANPKRIPPKTKETDT